MLSDIYKKEMVPKLMKELGYTNPMRIPKLQKIVVNSCVSDAIQNSKILDTVASEIALITGQKPVLTKAKKSIASFKLREGMPIGCTVTLRRERMFEFFNRLVRVALPRSRDFKGLPKRGFDGRGNYTIGITEQIIFPEITADRTDKIRGMNITIVTTAKTDKEGEALLRMMGLPLRS
ncbi:MAG: 50S ribosomal protein L5 [Deltaproteobacteria bacterium RIFCSPLOWO2_12_FULL_40_28]|nr:MAG: 50S ribosomal protein L5 [Deltaproteobacteria bacterium RIFCSPHIGHO2_02_FULL_40_28]OGQ18997.1 MAG: 50S ribosomal protein L5 [Deltaproteobacteria bacterium RIFCSPHIGHO2_12_FULL_40_32]OGQ39540.1 MAG: 50S ribosomal protein L5 [Deltaproteobacteria bacterium RIFCSPLOWO2_02_FULL_40_36]OGQ53430.1 MAG: 50S ribosomal protein L5 [Deltaproteobacteria bacterium RIFCSPLOWO2_12_FULL_40_28]